MTQLPPGRSGTHHLDGSICTQMSCTHPQHSGAAPSPGIAMLQQQLQQGLQQGQFQLANTASAPTHGQASALLECECCEEYVAALPYTHTDHNPPYTTWSYCQDCYDAGCSGPNGTCEREFADHDLGDCVVCNGIQVPLAIGDWCIGCYDKYQKYLETHPIPPKDKFTPVWRGQQQLLKHMPAYMYSPDEWPSIDFKPEYLLNPASAPPSTRKKAHIVSQQPQTTETEDERIRRMIDERLQAVTGQPGIGVALPGDPASIDDVLESIDPRDSDTALKLFNWLKDNSRLHRVATLEQGGYLFLYQEPEGASRQGYTAGGTQGDRIVDDALEKAQATGGKPLKGLCKHCLSSISQVGSSAPEAEQPRPGTNPTECSGNGGGAHEFAG